MLEFILNNENISTDLPPGTTVLDFVRYHQHLTGTKIGCREGDCGACTVMVGELTDAGLQYRTGTSCLMPLANVSGKHVVTVEGINPPQALTPVQTAMVEENGSQCGFCTVGFVMSFTNFCLSPETPGREQAIAAIDGNICRCTGYKSIERAGERLVQLLQARKGRAVMDFAVAEGIVPAYFSDIQNRLRELRNRKTALAEANPVKPFYIGGGTDLYVQRPETLTHTPAQFISSRTSMRGISEIDGFIEIGAACTVTDMMESPVLRAIFPNLEAQLKLISSTPIRNMATVGGNLVNASPIGDLTVWLLAMNAEVVLRNDGKRTVPLRNFYHAYKIIDKTPAEIVEKIRFRRPMGNWYFNFEKVSKRTYLDIASVNSAIFIKTESGFISEVHLSAGGVAPVPLYLNKTSAFLFGKKAPREDGDLIRAANEVLQSEINPISDIRGSAEYKRLLLRQLFLAHFLNQPAP